MKPNPDHKKLLKIKEGESIVVNGKRMDITYKELDYEVDRSKAPQIIDVKEKGMWFRCKDGRGKEYQLHVPNNSTKITLQDIKRTEYMSPPMEDAEYGPFIEIKTIELNENS